MTNPPIENLNILDTDYAEILANSMNPEFELQLINYGISRDDARKKTRFITLMSKKPTRSEEWEDLMDAWQESCGYRPKDEDRDMIVESLWEQNE